MGKKSTALTPKEIYHIIKEKPYRDGEALILEYGKSIRSDAFKEVILFLTEVENNGETIPSNLKVRILQIQDGLYKKSVHKNDKGGFYFIPCDTNQPTEASVKEPEGL